MFTLYTMDYPEELYCVCLQASSFSLSLSGLRGVPWALQEAVYTAFVYGVSGKTLPSTGLSVSEEPVASGREFQSCPKSDPTRVQRSQEPGFYYFSSGL